jgi:hypothetical protein
LSFEGFFVRFFLGFAVGVAAVVVAVGCAVEHRATQGGVLGAGAESGSWASPTELAWLKKLGVWDTRLRRGLQTAAHSETTPRLARRRLSRDGLTMVMHAWALEPASSCAADLRSKVGPAPSARLEKALDTLRRACTHLQRFHSAVTLAIYQHQDEEVQQAQREAKRFGQVLLQADQMLPPGEVRPLPVIAGAAEESRLEPRFGRIASALAGKQIEVRCWSSVDWPYLIREERAYTHGTLNANTLGFADIGGNRVNLGPSVCGGLVDLAYKRARPTDEIGQFLLAAAVVTLSHEPQHSKGVAEESVAECNAIQLAIRTAVELGASSAYAASLVRTYWRHYNEELPAYRSPQCRKGGTLDLGQADSIWP